MTKPKSIFVQLLIPIATVILILLLFASATVSTIYRKQTQATAIQSNLEILAQTSTSLCLVHDHIAKTASTINQTDYLTNILASPMDSLSEEWRRRHILGTIFSNSPSAMVDYETVLVGTNGLAVSSGVGGVTVNADNVFELPAFKSSLISGHIAYGSSSSGFSYSTQKSSVIYGCKALTKPNKEISGAIIIMIQEKSLRQFYQSFSNRSTDILLISSDGTILSSATGDDIGTNNQLLIETAQYNNTNQLSYSVAYDNSIVLSLYIPQYDAFAVSQIKPALLLSSFAPRIQTVTVICVTLFLLFLSILYLTRRSLLPLQYLSRQMANTKGLPTPVFIYSCSEMEQISTSYNQMIETLEQYLDEINKAHEKQRQDELNLLQMQINPHFLYNTLDSVKHLVSMNNSDEACLIIDSLISLLRNTLNKTNTTVSVAEEINNINNYIAIITPRYGGLIQAEVHAEASCLNYEIPNLLLQPLVENAFFHAFQTTKSGKIHVFIYSNQEKLFCEITDNGDGMSERQLETLFQKDRPVNSVTRIGLVNVKERLAMIYPDNSSFQIVSESGYGTNITLSFPAINKKTDN